MNRKSILVIKHGYSDSSGDTRKSGIHYSDVFRSTCLLEDFKGYEVTWITSEAACDLFLDNHLIDRLIVVEKPSHLVPKSIGEFHTVINLENSDAWSRFAAEASAQHRYGFIGALPSPGAIDSRHTFQDSLYRHLGRQWSGQRYSLGYQPRSDVVYDIGFNNFAFPDIPAVNWPGNKWQRLYNQLKDDFRVSWPTATDDLQNYMEWIASCQLVLSPDTLGLHLAMALKKKVVALVGVEATQQPYLYGCGAKLQPASSFGCPACELGNGNLGHSCMEEISVAMVRNAIEAELNELENSHQLESLLFMHESAYSHSPNPA